MNGRKNSLLPRGFKAEAERIAVEFRKKLGLTGRDPLCAFNLADYLEIPTYSPAEVGLSSSDSAKLMKNGSGWSGLTMKNSDEEFLIIFNSRHSAARQQSTIMHELAHIICKHELPEPVMIAGTPLPLRIYDEQMEAEAEWLGANLQITREGLLYVLKKGKTTEEIAEHYNASSQMVTYRINITGVKNQLRYSRKYV